MLSAWPVSGSDVAETDAPQSFLADAHVDAAVAAGHS
jgi:hypothetical protein